MADDPEVDDQTHAWVFQALADISGERLGYDIADWRDWWAKGPQPRSRRRGNSTPLFRWWVPESSVIFPP